MADSYRSKNFRDVARYAHLMPDGTIHYFESDGKNSSESTLPPGTDPADVEAQGFTFLDAEAYDRTRTSLDPIIRAENADADDLAEAFDASIGAARDIQRGEAMNGQGEYMLSPEMMEILQQYAQEGRLGELFQPFQQEQGVLGQESMLTEAERQQAQDVLGQEMGLAQGLRQRGPQRSTPTGALLGGLSNALGNIGGAVLQQKALVGQQKANAEAAARQQASLGAQMALGQRMQGDAARRVGAILRAAEQRRGMTGLMTPAVDDATLANIFSGG